MGLQQLDSDDAEVMKGHRAAELLPGFQDDRRWQTTVALLEEEGLPRAERLPPVGARRLRLVADR